MRPCLIFLDMSHKFCRPLIVVISFTTLLFVFVLGIIIYQSDENFLHKLHIYYSIKSFVRKTMEKVWTIAVALMLTPEKNLELSRTRQESWKGQGKKLTKIKLSHVQVSSAPFALRLTWWGARASTAVRRRCTATWRTLTSSNGSANKTWWRKAALYAG